MELKEENTEVLKAKLHKTKRTMQILTWGVIIALAFFIYGFIQKDEGFNSSFSLISITLSFFVIILDKKHKKIKAELESRE